MRVDVSALCIGTVTEAASEPVEDEEVIVQIAKPSNSAVQKAGDAVRRHLQGEGPAPTAEQLAVLEEWRISFRPALHASTMGLRSAARTLGLDGRFIKGRPKKQSAITAKLLLKPRMRLPQMEDVAGCRIVLPSQSDVYRMRDHVLKNWRTVTWDLEDNYVDSPRTGGYRAVHLHTTRAVKSQGLEIGRWKVEVQLRTTLQHRWADEVEGFDEAVRTDVKHELAPAEVVEYWRARAAVYAAADSGGHDGEVRRKFNKAVTALQEYLRRQSDRG